MIGNRNFVMLIIVNGKSTLRLLLAALMTGASAVTVGAQDVAAISDHHQTSPQAVPSAMVATPVDGVTDLYGGVAVTDDYRWLEADPRTSPQVQDWVSRQNAHSRDFLDGLQDRPAILAHLEQRSNIEAINMVQLVGGQFFYFRRAVGEEQWSYWVRSSDQGEPRKLIDPATWSTDGSSALAAAVPDRSGRYVAYAVQEAGADWRTWHVVDVKTGQILPDVLRWNKFSNISWDKDSRGFYYTRFPAPEEGQEFRAGNSGLQLFYHRLGTHQSQDRFIYANKQQPDHLFMAMVSDDGQHIIVNSGYVGGGADVRVAKVNSRHFKPFFPTATDSSTSYRYVATLGTHLLFLTNDGAPNSRLISVDARDPARPAQVIIPEQQHMPLVGVSLASGRLFAQYLDDAKSKILVYDLDGTPRGEVALPAMGSAKGFSGGGGQSDHADDVYYSFSSFAIPSSVYRYNISSGQSTLVWRPKAPVNPDDYRVEQAFFTARDGKKIAMFLASRKTAKWTKDTPVLLYGYGGFNLSFPPDYRPEQVTWMDMGGIFAFPILPGGGEYGETWHQAGMLENKPAVFDAFTDAADYLVAQGYSSPARLAAYGASNGGLLVGAAMTRRPDLFAVALPNVGVLDMLRFPQFTNGRLWEVEYGSPSDPKLFPILRGYSPYHNLVTGPHYPATLISTGDTDDRVYPAHSFKYAARLQAVAAADRPALLSVATNAGHGAGMPRSQAMAGAADRLAFTFNAMGLKLPDDFAAQQP